MHSLILFGFLASYRAVLGCQSRKNTVPKCIICKNKSSIVLPQCSHSEYVTQCWQCGDLVTSYFCEKDELGDSVQCSGDKNEKFAACAFTVDSKMLSKYHKLNQSFSRNDVEFKKIYVSITYYLFLKFRLHSENKTDYE